MSDPTTPDQNPQTGSDFVDTTIHQGIEGLPLPGAGAENIPEPIANKDENFKPEQHLPAPAIPDEPYFVPKVAPPTEEPKLNNIDEFVDEPEPVAKQEGVEVDHIPEPDEGGRDVEISIDQRVKQVSVYQRWLQESGTVRQELPLYDELKEDTPISGDFTDLLEIGANDTMRTILDASLKDVVTEDNEQGMQWLGILENGARTQSGFDQYLKSLSRPGSDWRQFCESQSGRLKMTPVVNAKNSGNLTGAAAISHFNSSGRVGKQIRIPLYHSGFWVTIKTPTTIDQAEMLDQLRNVRVNAGTQTFGRVFNHYTTIANQIAAELAYESIIATSLDIDIREVRRFVVLHDLPILIWGLAASIWPNGFEYERAKMGDPSKPENIVTQRIKVENAQWTDITELNEWQRDHMAKKQTRSMKVEQLETYRNHFKNQGMREVVIQEESRDFDKITATIRVPYADDYIVSGNRWINDILNMYMSVADRPGGNKARDEYVMSRMNMTEMRAYSHWVYSLSTRGGEVTDPETILKILDNLSSRGELRANLIKSIFKYIDDTTISIIGVTTDDAAEPTLPRFPFIIPIEPVHTFFTRLEQKFQQE